MTPRHENVLVTDFDGTMTRHDFFRCAIEQLLSPDDTEPWQRYEHGELSHFDALARIFARIRAPMEAIDRVLDSMELDERVATAVDTLHRQGWTVVVVSNGCKWYIDRLLNRIGVRLPVISNPGRYEPEQGLLMSLPEQSPFFRSDVGIAKEQVVQHYRRSGRTVAFAGDGRPDVDPALLVDSRHCFATGWLNERLDQMGHPHQRFQRWSEIAAELTEGEPNQQQIP
jgi:2,3-diketo-5-methylthio-1-phosphopentane phosphatase